MGRRNITRRAGFEPPQRAGTIGHRVYKAVFPGNCAFCGGPYTEGAHIVDSGQRGPRGGKKKYAHMGCRPSPPALVDG